MHVALVLAPLAVLSLAAEQPPMPDDTPRLAVVTAHGRIAVSTDGGTSWIAVHHCASRTGGPADEHDSKSGCTEPPAVLAWYRGALHLACTGGPLLQWHSDSGVEPMSALRGVGVAALAGGESLLVIEPYGAIWSYSPEAGARSVAQAPEAPIAIAAAGGALVIAGGTATWLAERPYQTWSPIAPVRACALAVSPAVPAEAAGAEPGSEVLWLAGPSGLIELHPHPHGRALRVREIAPLTGVTRWGGTALVADGTTIWVVAVSDPVASPVSPAGDARGGAPATLLTLNRPGDWPTSPRPVALPTRRMAMARWLPRLAAGAIYGCGDLHRGTELWLHLSWTLEDL